MTRRKAVELLSMVAPTVTTFGRTGIVLRSLQEQAGGNLTATEVLISGTIAIAYWALFSGSTYGFVSHNMRNRAVQNNPGYNYISRTKRIVGYFGFTLGLLFGVSEGCLNFLGTRHLFLVMCGYNTEDPTAIVGNSAIDYYVPSIFGICSLSCWFMMVAPKVRDYLIKPSKVFSHTGVQSGCNAKYVTGTVLGGSTGLIAGVGMGLTAEFGVLEVLAIPKSNDQSSLLSDKARLLISVPFFLASAISASLFYMNSNSDWAQVLADFKNSLFGRNSGELTSLPSRWHRNKFFAIVRPIKWLLCISVIVGGFYATYALSAVAIDIALNTINSVFFEKEQGIESDFQKFYISLSAICLAMTATAVSGRYGCRFILSESSGDNRSIVRNPNGDFFPSRWFSSFYADELDKRQPVLAPQTDVETPLVINTTF